LNSSLPILKKILKISITDFGAGFSPIYGAYTTMYVRRPWTIRQYAGFSTAEESNAFIDVILLQDKRTIDRFRFADTPWSMIQITNA
jgi:hypothetical protein